MELKFTISEKSFELLKEFNRGVQAEFRDTQYKSLEEFKQSDEFKSEGEGMGTERWFKARNFCDMKDLEELIKYNLIDIDGESWHITYEITPLGKEMMANN